MSISTKSTLAPKNSAQFAEATNVTAEVKILDFLFIPNAMQDKCKAAVPVAHATAYFAPTYFAKSFSKSTMLGPCVIKSDFKT